ncbi:MAG: hypothetical protein MUD08_11220, partial [Cytophagales bacterium]|nr:hypothetical protein [Cytophagales bacterium]
MANGFSWQPMLCCGRPVGNTHAPAFWAIFVKNVRFDEANQDSQKRRNEKAPPFSLLILKILFSTNCCFRRMRDFSARPGNTVHAVGLAGLYQCGVLGNFCPKRHSLATVHLPLTTRHLPLLFEATLVRG